MKSYNNTSKPFCKAESNTNQYIIVREILLSGLWVLIPLINRFGFFQGKNLLCFETQKNLAKDLGVSRECINWTIQFMVAIGILRIRKVRRVWVEWVRKNGKKVKKVVKSQWLHNEYHLLPIMFTKVVVESLEGVTNHHFFDAYVSPRATLGNVSKQAKSNFYSSSITLIESSSSSLLETCTKNSQSEEVGYPKMTKSELFAVLVL